MLSTAPGVKLVTVAALSTVWLMPCVAAAQPRPDTVRIVRPPQATVVYDRTGGLIGEIGPEVRTWVRLVDLPAHVGQAFVAIEDRRFYQHDGVDVVGIVGALRDNLLRGFGSRGASTITQQLVGAMGLVDRRDISLARKLREAEYARALERRHTKAEILEAYINYINFGRGWYGIEAAARHIFGKQAADLTLAEAALLAGLPNSPSNLDPRRNPTGAVRRRNLVLRRMEEQRFITAYQRRMAEAEPLRLARDDGYSVRAPWVLEWVRRWLAERYGLSTVNTGGLQVYTTIEPSLQAAAATALAAGLARVESLPGYRWPRYSPGARTATPGPTRAARTPYLQGLMVALDPATGDVLALVGGRDFRDSEFNRAVQGLRQAGSAFKPFVFAAALAAGIAPNLLLEDAPIDLPRGDGTRWRPENSDGSWSGQVTLRLALVRSINIPTIRLALLVGMDSIAALANRLGLSTPIPPYAASAIGAADVRPIELISAYTAFATLGYWTPPRLVTVVQNAEGIPVYDQSLPPQSSLVLDPRIAYQVTSMLQEAVDRGTGTAVRRVVPRTIPVAGKTGTTNDNADVWFIGYTPDLVAGVWLGFDRRQTIMPGAFGGTLAAPIWAQFARDVYRTRPAPNDWTPPAGLVAVRVRRSDGQPAGEEPADSTVTEWFLEGTEPTPGAIANRILRRLGTLLRIAP